MKELEDKLQLLQFSPYIYCELVAGKYICTTVIKNNNIPNKDLLLVDNLAKIDKLKANGDLFVSIASDANVYIAIAKVLSDLITNYYNIIIKPQIIDSVRGKDFIFGLVIQSIIDKIASAPKPELYFQLIKSFMTIDQNIFDVATIVTDINDFVIEDAYLTDIYAAKFGKVFDGKNKNPILHIAYIYTLAKKNDFISKITFSDPHNYTNGLESENISDIYIGNGREKVLFDLDAIEKPKLLLHICCAPDLTYPLYWLKRYFKIYLFWYNPNIHPRAEHDLRYEQYLKLFQLEQGDYEIVEDWYDPKEFFDSFIKYRNLIKEGMEELDKMQILKVAGEMEERSARCDPCYLMRLEQAATMAAKLNIPYFTSTLLISPKKVATKLFRRGLGAQERVVHSKFLRFDFAKKDGYNKASELTKDYDLYRQNYCGCGWTIPKKGEPIKEYRGG